jgi:8-oxo-dGTP diphosphatase
VINSDAQLASAIGADGVHLTSTQLMAATSRPDFPLVGASAHTREELEHAARLGIDFAVLGPVLNTVSHPGSPGIGWEGFSALAAGLSLPVYALGGLGHGDLERAQDAGAHGIAAIRGSWDALPR